MKASWNMDIYSPILLEGLGCILRSSWKQLDAYNYFQAGYVRNVLSKGFSHDGSTFCLLKAKLASQKSPDLAHEAWIVAKQDGDIIFTCVHRILLNA